MGSRIFLWSAMAKFGLLMSRHRPGAPVFTSWSSQPLPSGSLNEANEL
ncbi:hypothetical protein LC609_05945 [Nostoc sp. XA013]|nr:hypothetical protein [Nostoc sp. XA013]